MLLHVVRSRTAGWPMATTGSASDLPKGPGISSVGTNSEPILATLRPLLDLSEPRVGNTTIAAYSTGEEIETIFC